MRIGSGSATRSALPSGGRRAPRWWPVASAAGVVVVAVAVAVAYVEPTLVDSAPTGSADDASLTHRTDHPLDSTCPETFDVGGGAPEPTARGPLVSDGAVGVRLCTYGFGEGSYVKPLTSSQRLSDGVDDVVAALNGLPVRPGAGDGRAEAQTTCALMGRPAYRLVLTYSDAAPAIVDIRPNCATASRDGVVRSLADLPGVLSFWQEPATPHA